ncbi:phosphomannomutase [Pseudoalteromonas sp. MMG012]|uniref:phosphomannomutase n=1 Tax=Pseudoalteromonas sp. MMG012 TaxID=2822686 RepID=UPI001B3A0728|nr:phosphomannomutase [Pseudoalteromonas sp. MMG012]MBQ4849214.1 phosphomannomutase [Pseudoalteromonas sp. MMG012]
MLVSSDVIKRSEVSFGTSGVRGLVTRLSKDVCAAFTVNFINAMQASFDFDEVAIAIDNRPSSVKMAQACAASLSQLNIKVIYFGVVPTPALAYSAMCDRIPAIMVTGSHIPFDRNGLKFYRPDGEITKDDETSILNASVEFKSVFLQDELFISKVAEERYIERYTSLFDKNIFKGLRVGVYEHSSAGRDLYAKIFTQLGAQVIPLGRSDEFVPIDTEAVSLEDKQRALVWVKKYQLDMLFSTDGDGDRPLVADEKGDWFRGDILGLLCAKALGIDVLAVPVSCNSAIELSQAFKQVVRTKIGSPYVISAFASHCYTKIKEGINDKRAHELTTVYSIAGFEANGGFLLGSDMLFNGAKLNALVTRDALLPALIVFADVVAKKEVLSSSLKKLPERFTDSDRVQNTPSAKSQLLLEKAEQTPKALLKQLGVNSKGSIAISNIDGVKMTFDGLSVHLRPSGNAPELRCYVESSSSEHATVLLNTIMYNLKMVLSK